MISVSKKIRERSYACEDLVFVICNNPRIYASPRDRIFFRFVNKILVLA